MGEMNTLLTASHPSLVKLGSSGRIESALSGASLKSVSIGTGGSSDPEITVNRTATKPRLLAPPTPPLEKIAAARKPQDPKSAVAKLSSSPSGVVSPDHPAGTATGAPPGQPADLNMSNGNGVAPASSSTSAQPKSSPSSTSTKACGSAPLKSTTYAHLCQKYLHELEYMLTEFQKLERQLLGAKAATRESDGSRERREKLHSFIMHLQDTIQQLHAGRGLEMEGKSTLAAGCGASAGGDSATQDSLVALKDSALASLTEERREEETVQKLEEHILANLLPVKVRLKKQLAAQQGARHNPAGMPVRGTTLVAAPDKGKATFGAAVEESRRRASLGLAGGGSGVADGDARKPPGTGGSNLVAQGPSSSLPDPSPLSGDKTLHAGQAIGNDPSCIKAESGIHKLLMTDPVLMEMARAHNDADSDLSLGDIDVDEPDLTPSANQQIPTEESIAVEDHIRRLKKKRKRKKLREEQSTHRDLDAKKLSQSKRKKRGPWPVEYMCALCNEVYSATCDYNPWWALQQQECPKCQKTQIPRIDIGAPANAIEYHPALLAHAEENGGGTGGGGAGGGTGGGAAVASVVQPSSPMHMPSSHLKPTATFPTTAITKDPSDSDSTGSDLSDEDWEGLLSDDSDADSYDSDLSDPVAFAALSPSEQCEHERFGEGYIGPKLSEKDASRLLTLMAHASTCPCQHKLPKHRDVCRSTKWMMLHVRDCPGTTSTFDVCPFPWCRKVKNLLYHLVSCQVPENCGICSPSKTSMNLKHLRGLNEHRLKKYRERLVAQLKAVATAPSTVAEPAVIPPQTHDAILEMSKPHPDATPEFEIPAPSPSFGCLSEKEHDPLFTEPTTVDTKILRPRADELTDMTNSLPEGFPVLPREVPSSPSDGVGAAEDHVATLRSTIIGQASDQCKADASGPIPDAAESTVSSSMVEEHASMSSPEANPPTDSVAASKAKSDKKAVARPAEASNAATRRITRSRDAAERKALSVP